MFKTSMTVLLLTTAQEAFAQRYRRLSRQERDVLVEADILANDYTFENEIGLTGQCSERTVRRILGGYYTEKHRCENGPRVRDEQQCVDRAERRKVRRIDNRCLESSQTTVESVSSVSSGDESAPSTVVPPVSSDSDSAPSTVVPPISSDSDSAPSTVVPPVSSDSDSAPSTVVPPLSSDSDSAPSTVVPPLSSDSDSAPSTVVPPVSSDSDSAPSTVVPPVSSDDDSVTPPVVDPFTNGCDGTVPVMAIPASCQTYGCDQTKVIYDYTVLRVTEHNTRRQLHQNTPDVTFDLDIACQAYTWAKNMADNDDFSHAPSDQRPGQGENLAYSASTGTLGTFTPELGWYEGEEPYYDYVTGTKTDPAEQIGHFTQMVWDNTTNIGCGEARITRVDGNTGLTWNYAYSACRYTPPGNFVGTYTDHVQPLL